MQGPQGAEARVSLHEGGGVVQVSGQGVAVGEQGPSGGGEVGGALPWPLPSALLAASASV